MSSQQINNSNKIGVGLVGASPANPGWAVLAHIPVIQALPEYELQAVSTSSKESAEAAAKEYGVPAFSDYRELVRHPDVDLVVIAVNVSYHYDIARAAIEAGKMVFSEYPLGVTTSEAFDLAERAQKAGVRTVVGLQARYSPVIQYARDLVARGYVGRVLSTALNGTALIYGPVSLRKFAYTYDVNGGASMLASSGLHAIDGLISILGDFDEVTARLVVRHPEVQFVEDGTTQKVTGPDHLAIAGTLTGGELATVVYRSGTSRDVDLRWEITGTEGELVITTEQNGNLQNTDLKLMGGKGEDTKLHEMAVPDAYLEEIKLVPPGPALTGNIGYIYAGFAKDLREGTRLTPDFAHAVKRQRLYDTVMKASQTGAAQKVDSSDPF